MDKILGFLKSYVTEIGFVLFALLLMFLPTPIPIRTFGFGIFFATICNILVKYIIKINTKSQGEVKR